MGTPSRVVVVMDRNKKIQMSNIYLGPYKVRAVRYLR